MQESRTVVQETKGQTHEDTRKEKSSSSSDISEDNNAHRNVYIQCTGNLHTINMATEYQQAIKEEMKKFSKLERAVSQKKNFQADRLKALVESKGGRSGGGAVAHWFEESVQMMMKHLVVQAQSHVNRTDALGKQCTQIQAFLDSHQEVMSSLHEAEIENGTASSGPNNPTSIPRPRSPRKSITAPERRSEVATGASSDGNKWYISPPPLTPPRHRNQSGPMADFRRACIKYEAIRKSRMMLDNRVDYLLMQQKSIVNQLNEATGMMAGLPGVSNGKLSAWTTQSKLEDIRSRQEFLRNQKEQTEHEIREARNEMKEFDTSQSSEMDQILIVFEATKDRYENFLKQSLSVLNTAISSDSSYHSNGEHHHQQRHEPKYNSKTNMWETFDDHSRSSSRDNHTSRHERSPEISVLKAMIISRQSTSPPQHTPPHTEMGMRSSNASPVDHKAQGPYPKPASYNDDVNPTTGYWDDGINDTLHCGDDSSISEADTGANNTTCFETTAVKASTSTDTSKWLFGGNQHPSLAALADLGKQVLKEDYLSRRYSLQTTCAEKQQLSIAATNNKTNNRNVETSNSDLQNESSERLEDSSERSNVVVLRSKSAGKTSDTSVRVEEKKTIQNKTSEEDDEQINITNMISKSDDVEPPLMKNEEERNITMYIGKYLKCFKNTEAQGIGTVDNNISQHSPIAITVSKESRRQLRVCTVHPISPGSETVCRDDIKTSNCRSELSTVSRCKVSCRQESRTNETNEMDEQTLTLTDGESTGFVKHSRESMNNKLDSCCYDNDEDSIQSTKNTSSSCSNSKPTGCPDCKKVKSDKDLIKSSVNENGSVPRKEPCSSFQNMDLYDTENDLSTTVDNLQLGDRSRDRRSNYDDEDCEVKDIMNSLYAQNMARLETYKSSEKETMVESPHHSLPLSTCDTQTDIDGAGNASKNSSNLKSLEQRKPCIEKLEDSNRWTEPAVSISRGLANSVITLSTRKTRTKTMLFNSCLDKGYNLDHSDSESSMSLTASLTCSTSTVNDHSTVPILRPGGDSRFNRKGRRVDKNVRFKEEVEYNTFIDSEDRRNDYESHEDGGNEEENEERDESEGNCDEDEEDDSDTFPLID